VELIETRVLTKQVGSLLSDEEYAGFQSRLASNPRLGALIRGGGGIRKVRVGVGSWGTRGGARVICGSDTETSLATRESRLKEEFGSEETDV
jgi:hypothetical protein